MTKRRELERHLRGLGEIRDIMNAMKNLALMETHKLTRVLATQQRVVDGIQSAAADFLSFYPRLLPDERDAREVCVLMGSERGFCGDFNDAVARRAVAHAEHAGDAALVVIGSRLGEKLADDPRVAARLNGPTVLEEVESVLLRLMETLRDGRALPASRRPLRLTVFHHQIENGEISVSRLHPFRELEPSPPRVGHPPLLNLDPQALLAPLAEQYLFAVLHGLFYDSLMAENRRRMQHMGAAVERIDQQCRGLLRRRNILRQDEITEEIEVIMLSVERL